ncbi:hypothetical protein [Methanoplanus endosymbiosus]|uniref:CARDB domain-containing protein n=1 Tax=Methanoplanus endosymbiosus TaxID=33865 RepID=A0A9E7PP03_9EURY|nr:hypothetical protein [Methanoplanus endosymbiosus]UUX93784.1 hypothetical protein L6E24_06635 [Methanoplanus endosymbiosus]
MKKYISIKGIIVAALILCALLLTPASAVLNEDATHISIASYTVEPEALMQYDTGIITVKVTNSGTSPVDIRRVTLFSEDLLLINERSYDTVGAIGPATSREFTFSVKAAAPDGIYYPKFYIDFSSGGSLSYLIPVTVQSTPIEISVVSEPDEYKKDVESTIKLSIGNPRDNRVTGVVVRPVSDSAEFTQNSYFVGELEANKNKEVTFEMTPYSEGEVQFIAEYRNGINNHESVKTLDLNPGTGKKDADPVINNIESGYRDGIQYIAGDVTNAGLKIAKSVIVTTKSPAKPTEPNRLYVVGELEPDDFSSFEVTFETDEPGEIPLIVEYKDEDGNSYSKEFPVKTDSYTSSNAKTTGSGDEGMPVVIIILIVVVIAAVGGIIYHTWKK